MSKTAAMEMEGDERAKEDSIADSPTSVLEEVFIGFYSNFINFLGEFYI